MKKNINAFTLVEVVVSITIFSIMMISIISIYILSSDTSLKSDINRAMHENMKSVTTEISEDIMKNGIIWVSENTLDTCSFNVSTSYKQGSKLCTKWLNEYYLAKKIWTWFIRTDNITCENIAEQCYIVKNWKPLTNSLVTVKNIDFYVTSLYVNKVTVKIILQPTIKAWVKPNLIENNKLIFQTTISERPF